MSEIIGVTLYRHSFMYGSENHSFGLDGEGISIHSDLNGTITAMEFGENEKHFFHEFVDRLINEIMIFKWDKNYSDDYLDGEEWRLTIIYRSGRSRSFTGMNAYPSNYVNFIQLCKEYNFAFEDYLN
jgi:hypothetical protein